MGCSDSRSPLAPEEAAISEQESALGFSALRVDFICTTVTKYSRNDHITDFQLMRILKRLFPAKDELEEFKTRYFDRNVLRTYEKDYSRMKILGLGVLLGIGSNQEKVTELFYLLDSDCSQRVSKDQVRSAVTLLADLSVNYGPLLVLQPSPRLTAYHRELVRKTDTVTAAVVDYVVESATHLTLNGLIEKFNSKAISRFLSPQGIRSVLKEFSLRLETDNIKRKIRSPPSLASTVRTGNRVVAQAGSYE